MKKLLSILGIISLGFIMFTATAKAEIKATSFEDVVKEEIEIFGESEGYEDYVKTLKAADFSNYEESDDKVNVYIFKGSTCPHCFEAIVYFASIVKEYGDKFNLIAYEVWSNEDNSGLMAEVAEYFGEDVGGVPYIIIGDKTFQGYTESYNEDIISSINKNYGNKDAVDVMKEINGGTSDKKEKKSDVTTIVIIAVCIIGFAAMVFFARDTEVSEIEEIVDADEYATEAALEEVEEEVIVKPVVKTTKKDVVKTTTKKASTAKKAATKSTTTKKASTAKKTTAKKSTTKKTTKK